MTKKEIFKSCAKGLSEDINGYFYQLYDTDKMYNMIVDKARKWLVEHRCDWDSTFNGSIEFDKAFKKAMEE